MAPCSLATARWTLFHVHRFQALLIWLQMSWSLMVDKLRWLHHFTHWNFDWLRIYGISTKFHPLIWNFECRHYKFYRIYLIYWSDTVLRAFIDICLCYDPNRLQLIGKKCIYKYYGACVSPVCHSMQHRQRQQPSQRLLSVYSKTKCVAWKLTLSSALRKNESKLQGIKCAWAK